MSARCSNENGHEWVKHHTDRRPWCLHCRVQNGGHDHLGLRNTHSDTDPVPRCDSLKGHKWVPDLRTRERHCERCGMRFPLTKMGRANRVERIAKRDGWQCFYCAIPFWAEPRITEDHLLPQSLGGIRSDSNIVLACPLCNNWKGNGTEWQLRRLPKFKQRIQAIERRYGLQRWDSPSKSDTNEAVS